MNPRTSPISFIAPPPRTSTCSAPASRPIDIPRRTNRAVSGHLPSPRKRIRPRRVLWPLSLSSLPLHHLPDISGESILRLKVCSHKLCEYVSLYSSLLAIYSPSRSRTCGADLCTLRGSRHSARRCAACFFSHHHSPHVHLNTKN